METRLDSADRAIQDKGNLFQAKGVQIVENNDDALIEIQGDNRLGNLTVDITRLGLPFWRKTFGTHQPIDHAIQRGLPPIPAGLPAIGQVDRDPVQPGLKGQGGVNAMGILVYAEKTVLEDIFGRRGVVGDCQGSTVNAGLMALIQNPQRLEITALESHD